MSLFKRRSPRGFWVTCKNYVWPSMGWARTALYYKHRTFRTGDSTYKITAGLATGAAISFTPILGTHIIQALIISRYIKASYISAVIGTIIGNPSTFPFIFALMYKVGISVCGLFGLSDFIALPDGQGLSNFLGEPTAFFKFLWNNPVQFLLPLMIGGYILAVALWFIFYAVLYFPVEQLRTAYRIARIKRYKRIKSRIKKKAQK